MPWQKKINQRIAKAKLNAKKRRKESGIHLPSFPPLMEFPHSLGFHSPCVTPTPFRFPNVASASFRPFNLPHQLLQPPSAPLEFGNSAERVHAHPFGLLQFLARQASMRFVPYSHPRQEPWSREGAGMPQQC